MLCGCCIDWRYPLAYYLPRINVIQRLVLQSTQYALCNNTIRTSDTRFLKHARVPCVSMEPTYELPSTWVICHNPPWTHVWTQIATRDWAMSIHISISCSPEVKRGPSYPKSSQMILAHWELIGQHTQVASLWQITTNYGPAIVCMAMCA